MRIELFPVLSIKRVIYDLSTSVTVYPQEVRKTETTEQESYAAVFGKEIPRISELCNSSGIQRYHLNGALRRKSNSIFPCGFGMTTTTPCPGDEVETRTNALDEIFKENSQLRELTKTYIRNIKDPNGQLLLLQTQL